MEENPCLHMGLSMLVSHRVIEVEPERSQTSTRRSDVLSCLFCVHKLFLSVLLNFIELMTDRISIRANFEIECHTCTSDFVGDKQLGF